MGCLQADEEMDVIGDAAHALRSNVQAARSATEIFVKAWAPGRVDQWFAILCREMM